MCSTLEEMWVWFLAFPGMVLVLGDLAKYWSSWDRILTVGCGANFSVPESVLQISATYFGSLCIFMDKYLYMYAEQSQSVLKFILF